jgi:hypothetical protein
LAFLAPSARPTSTNALPTLVTTMVFVSMLRTAFLVRASTVGLVLFATTPSMNVLPTLA